MLSPFERHKADMKQISAGKYSKRLVLRDGDESNVKSFFLEVNTLLGNMEKMRLHNNALYNNINDLIKNLNKVMIDDDCASNPDIKKSIATLEIRLKEISEEFKPDELS
jgi:hypothetical protein